LCVIFWVFPRRLIIVECRRFGTLYLFHLQRLAMKCEVRWTGRGFKKRRDSRPVHNNSTVTGHTSLIPPPLHTCSLTLNHPLPAAPLPIGPTNLSKPHPRYKYRVLFQSTILHTSSPAFEDGTDKVFRNVGVQQ